MRWVIQIVLALTTPLVFAQGPVVQVYKTPSCGCCGDWVQHLKAAGFAVQVQDLEDLAATKARLGVPADLQSCHSAVVQGHVIEGHVPASDIRRLLEEHPDGGGLAVPGMPLGSPGMEYGNRKDPYRVILFDGKKRSVFASH
ncbi:MAG: DUF411 domain-containing protein [Pseudomonadota bacterium]|nr:DUF411 domain-containing protein [Pseudomonadota bacterium]